MHIFLDPSLPLNATGTALTSWLQTKIDFDFFSRKNTNQSNYKEAINFDWIRPALCTGNFNAFAGPLVYVSYVYCFQLIRI